MTSETETIPIAHEYVTDASFATRAARSYTRFLLSRPPVVLTLVVLLVVGIVALVAGSALSVPAFSAIGVIYLLVPVLAVPTIYLRTRSGNSRRVPVGSRIALGLGADAMRLDGPLGSSHTHYRAYSAVYRSGDFAILRLMGVRVYSLLPIQLLPNGDFEKLRDAIAAVQTRR
jgi:hypothetical protein